MELAFVFHNPGYDVLKRGIFSILYIIQWNICYVVSQLNKKGNQNY